MVSPAPVAVPDACPRRLPTAVLVIVGAVALLLLPAGSPPAHAEPPAAVTVEDTVGVVDADALSSAGDHFADGLVMLAIDPQGRFLGSYAGEDVKLPEGGFDSVQDDMRDAASDGQWQEAFVDGARTYAALLDRPW